MIKQTECIQETRHLSQNILHSSENTVDYLKKIPSDGRIDRVTSVIFLKLQNNLEFKFQHTYNTVLQHIKTTFSSGLSPEIFLTFTL